MKLYLVRHGKTDYSEKNTKIYQGFGVNLAPLSAKGVKQIQETAKDRRLKKARLSVSSPYTRALQTAAILSKELDLEIAVETDLHEWTADKRYQYVPDDEVEARYQEFEERGGQYPEGEERDWEDCQTLRCRALAALERYRGQGPLIVTCHGLLIQALSGGYRAKNGEIVRVSMRADGRTSAWADGRAPY